MDINTKDTALVITDPQNDFLSTEGVTWGLVGKSVTDNNTIEHIEFADGVTWGIDDILTLTTTATIGNDILYGDYRNNTIDGGAGPTQGLHQARQAMTITNSATTAIGFDFVTGAGTDPTS